MQWFAAHDCTLSLMRPRDVTSQSEVASLSGVSVSTVSRALNPQTAHLVNPRTREQILSASSELRFRPNALARGLRGRYSNTIGVIVHDIRDPYFAEGARAVADAAAEAGFLAVVCNSGRDPETELRYIRQMIDYKTAGLLFIGGGLDNADYRRELAPLVAAIEAYGGGVVALGPRLDRWLAEVPDNQGGAVLATEHLIGFGHRRIAFIDGPPGLRTSRERRLGYEQGLLSAGIDRDARLVRAGGYDAVGGMQALADIVESGTGFSAVFASNDAMAIGCLHELRRRGMRVPEDVSVVGFDDVPVAQWLAPPLTTVVLPMAKIGRAGVARLLTRLQRPDGKRGRRVNVHPCGLIVRQSTAPVLEKGTR